MEEEDLGGLDGLPLAPGDIPEPIGERLAPRDFAVLTSGIVDPEYQYCSLELEGGERTAVVVITALDEKLLVAIPGQVWNRAVSKRKLASRALVKATPVAVAACHIGKRFEEKDIVSQLRVWVGCLQPEFEAQLDFVRQEAPDLVFGHDGDAELVPFGAALVEVAQEHFAFQTAESDFRGEKGAGDRMDKLEAALGSLQATLTQLVEKGTIPVEPRKATPPVARPKPAPQSAASVPRGGQPSKPTQIPGLDESTCQAAIAAGIPVEHLREMGVILKQKPRRLDDLPRTEAAKKERGPLDESEGEEEEPELVPDGGASGGADGVEKAILQLTKIATKLTEPKEKKDWFDSLVEGGSGSAASSGEAGAPSSRRNAAAMRALQKALVERPKQIYQSIEANLAADFMARAVVPGEPFAAGATTRAEGGSQPGHGSRITPIRYVGHGRSAAFGMP